MSHKKTWYNPLSWFIKAEPKSAKEDDSPYYPLGLHLGASVTLAKDCTLQLKDLVTFDLPAEAQTVCAIGEIDLGHGEKLFRFYLDDDRFYIQAHQSSGDMVTSESISLFHYDDVEQFTGLDAAFAEMVGDSEKMTGTELRYAEADYLRAWGSEQRDNVNPAEYEESVITADSAYSVIHSAMLYSRKLGQTARMEHVLISIEETSQGEVTGTHARGVLIAEFELNVL